MTTIEDILNTANLLAAEGKKPSVALIKAKLGAGAPLPLIISALKNWSYDPEKQQANSSETKRTNELKSKNEQKETVDSDKLALQIQIALQPLQQELTEIKHLLQQLVNSKS